MTNDRFFACRSSHRNPSDVVAALIYGSESTLKVYSRQGDEITLTPIETKHHAPRKFHASRITIQGVLLEIVRRSARRKR
ncbi:MAG: hypothetical protein LAP85_29560 [Acidobacteriia bacterium]|nr:hypothetical protein [Terriglobia bacterium]